VEEFMHSVDLNCDMGEGCPNDAALMDLVSSANIACGFHAGDAETMRQTVLTAIKKGVAIGAHPSFPDRENFGRTPMSLPIDEVYKIVKEQVTALKDICDDAGGKLGHVKPHGALYNQAARDPELAAVIAKAVRDIDPKLVLFGLSGSFSITEGEKAGIRTASETFADRTYRSDGNLTPRTEPNALISDIRTAAAQALQMVDKGSVIAADGVVTRVKADSICIHGDGEYALAIAGAIRELLLNNDINICPLND
jgi:UPF0271 protein